MTIEQQALDLVKENEALKAQVNLFKYGVTWFNQTGGDMTNLLQVYTSTPEQCLNSVKADAIEFAAEQINGQCDGEMCYEILMNNADEVRNK